MKYTGFLNELPYYPSKEQVNEASNEAQTAATEYVLRYDEGAYVTVDDGEIYVNSDMEQDIFENAQVIFDEVFGEIITKIQADEMAKSEIKETLLDSIIKDNWGGQATHCIDDYDSHPEGWDCIFQVAYNELNPTEKSARRAVIFRAFNLY